jgi:hypothetical protein
MAQVLVNPKFTYKLIQSTAGLFETVKGFPSEGGNTTHDCEASSQFDCFYGLIQVSCFIFLFI